MWSQLKKLAGDCPVCGGKLIRTCRCRLNESECENGHQWHRCGVHGTTVIGEREDKLPMDVCTCNKEG